MPSLRIVLALMIGLSLVGQGPLAHAGMFRRDSTPARPTARQLRKQAFRQSRDQFRALLQRNPALAAAHRDRLQDIGGNAFGATVFSSFGFGAMGVVIGGALATLGAMVGDRTEVFMPMVMSMTGIGAGGGALMGVGMIPDGVKAARTETVKAALKDGALERTVAAGWLRAGLINSTSKRKRGEP